MNLWFWPRTALLFLVRSRRSTLILFLMVFFAVAALVFLSSLAVGVNDTMIENSVSLYSGHVSGADIPTPISQEHLVIEGVAQVLKRNWVPGVLSSDGRREKINMIFIDPREEMKRTAIWKKMVTGRYPAKGERTVCLGSLLAERLGLQTGDLVSFSSSSDPLAGQSLKISGIFKTGLDLLDRDNVFGPVDILPGSMPTWSAAIFLEKGVEPTAVIATYRRLFPETGRFQSWEQLMPDLRQLIDLNYLSMLLVMVLVFAVVALGISCAFIIFILKNIREYGIMKAMGVTSGETAVLIGLEVILLNLAAAMLGVVLGVTIVFFVAQAGIDLTQFTSHNRYFSVSGIIYPRLTVYSLWLPPALAFLFSLIATIWPTVLVSRKKAAEILRIV